MPSEQSKESFQAQIAEAASDADRLKSIELRLSELNAPWVMPLRLQVVDMRRKLLQSGARELSTRAETSSTVPPAPTRHWLEQFGLPTPDGRPLYGYRVSSERFRELEGKVKAAAQRFRLSRPQDAALFVLWAAEWFRRSFKGSTRRWRDIDHELGLSLSQLEWRTLTDRGLKVWKLTPIRLQGGTHRLLSLARQGGFPVAAIDGGTGGRTLQYLERLVGVLLAESDPSTDIAFDHAQALKGMLPDSWQGEDFYVVCADLALAVVALRRDADAGSATSGLPPSLWLDVNRPSWRETLPIVIEDSAGGRLIDGLMRTAAVKGGSGSVRVTRVLEKSGDVWRERVQFELNGALTSAGLAGLDAQWSRLRMFAATALARHVPAELAVVEPDEKGGWIASQSTAQQTFDVPLSTPIQVELRGEGRRIGEPLELPNGDAIANPMLVCYTEEDRPSSPARLIVSGTAGGKYRADPLFVVVPAEWSLSAADTDASCGVIESVDTRRTLWRVQGGASVTDATGDRFSLLAGQPADQRDVLSLSGEAAPRCRSPATGTVIRGRPKLFVRDKGKNRTPEPNEIWWRQRGTRGWRSVQTFDGIGHCEFGWRDAQLGILRDRRDALILPPDFTIRLRRIGDRVELEVGGWSGTVLAEQGTRLESGCWTFAARSFGAARLRLMRPGQDTIELEVPLPHQAWIGDWVGKLLAQRARFSFAQMHTLVARADGKAQLQGQLYGRGGRRIQDAEIRWSFDRELPLNAIRDDIAGLLRPLADIDAGVRLAFDDSRGEYWEACEFDTGLECSGGRVSLSAGIVEESAEFVGRAIHHPQKETHLGAFDLVARENYRPLDVSHLEGCWLIYLRAGGRVLSRPLRYLENPLGDVPADPLGRVMAIDDQTKRLQAIESFFEAAESETGDGSVRQIIDLVASLDGLPPSTFDILQRLPRRPLLVARLLFEASEQSLPKVVALAESLPFAWCLIPRKAWDKAAQLRVESILRALPTDFPNREHLANANVAGIAQSILRLEPATAPLLRMAGQVPGIRAVAQAFMQRSHDQTASVVPNPFRPVLALRLPSWPFGGEYWRALDAPCAAALCAAGVVTLDETQLRTIKDVARNHPRYFEQAFAATYRECALA